jgi:hypothetical protein
MQFYSSLPQVFAEIRNDCGSAALKNCGHPLWSLKMDFRTFATLSGICFRICWGAEILCSSEPDSDPKIMLDLDRKRAHTYIYINFRSGAKSGSASNIIFGSESDSA